MAKTIDEIEQRRAHAINMAWVRAMPDEMLNRWYRLIVREWKRRKKALTIVPDDLDLV